MMKFSYSAVWDDTVRLIRAHGSLLAALAGVFMFLPALLVGYALPQPNAPDMQQMINLLGDYLRANWIWLLLQNLLNLIGAIAMLRLAFPNGGSTVAGVIAAAVSLLPFYFLATLLSSFIIGIGFVLFILPGLYLIGRLAPVGPVIVAENRRNPIDALRRTFELTKGRGWAVLGLVLVVAIAAFILMAVINNLLGLTFILVAGQETGLFLTLIVGSATSAAFATLLVLLYAAIYRNLAPASSAEVFQ
jgi:hypothetical protein